MCQPMVIDPPASFLYIPAAYSYVSNTHITGIILTMKHLTLAAALLFTLTGSAQAGLLDAVTETASSISTATGAGSSTDEAVLELVKTKVKAGATKAEVKAKLGAPKAIETVSGNEIWKYDLSSVSDKASGAMALASTLGTDTKKADKIVTLKFEGDAVQSYALVDGTLTN
jgi:outer membrane protein assembly factor BamE (lipoprotein component of BamABCDE complex)